MARWYCRRWRQDRKLWGRRKWRWMWYVTLPVCNDFSLVLFSDSARTHKDRFKRKRFCYFWVSLLIETFAEEKSVSDGFRAVLFNFTCTLTKQINSYWQDNNNQLQMHQQLSPIFLLEFCFFRYSTTTKYTSSSIRSVLFYSKGLQH